MKPGSLSLVITLLSSLRFLPFLRAGSFDPGGMAGLVNVLNARVVGPLNGKGLPFSSVVPSKIHG